MSIDLEDRPVTNIKNVTIPEGLKSSDLPFDPRIDIPPSLRAQMVDKARAEIQKLKGTLQDIDLESFQLLQSIAIVFPEKVSSLIDDELLEMLAEELKREELISEKMLIAATMKLVARPGVKNPGKLTDAEWEEAITNFNLTRSDRSLSEITLKDWFNLKIIDPQRTKDLSLPEEVWQAQAKLMPGWFTGAPFDGSIGYLAQVRIVDPSRVKQLGLNEELWDSMRFCLNEQIDDPITAIGFVSSMSILAAREVRITERGIELVFDQPDKLDTAPQVPQTKKY